MTRRYRLAKQLLAEMEDIWLHIAQDSPPAADRQIEAFYERFLAIARHPRSGRPRPDLGPGLRSALVGSYVVIYRLKGNRIEIVHVIHGSRDLPNLL